MPADRSSPKSRSPIIAPATLGMLGGGQLGRYFVAAAHEMGYRVWVLDPDPHSPAGRIADHHLRAAYDDAAALQHFASACTAITTEFENVPAATLAFLAKHSIVHPSAAAVAICQDRIDEKQFIARHALPHAPFQAIYSAAELDQIDTSLYPAILKLARLGYDGKGQANVTNLNQALQAFQQFGNKPCVLEKRLRLECEISVVLARDAHGQTRCFPAIENRHHNGILELSISPARISTQLHTQAQQLACRLAEALAFVGTLAVEFFISNGQLQINEIAPRPHNSGHHTLDSCLSSQYEQQLRALCGLPLGQTHPHSQAVMVNLLGDLWFPHAASKPPSEPDWPKLHAIADLRLHLYGKQQPRPGRKMGHFTLIGKQADVLLAHAEQARQAIAIPKS